MKNTKIQLKPEVLVTDFDRTLTYLYREPALLPELANRIYKTYSRHLKLKEDGLDRSMDGYLVWHKLHDEAFKILDCAEAERINKQAEDVVTEFELQIVKRVGLFPEIPKAIRDLRTQGIRLGVVSSNATSVVRYALKEAGILDEFEYVEGRPDPFHPERLKPSPYPLEKALENMKARNASFWYVGDDKVDMAAATAAKVTAVGVCTGRYLEAELKVAGADYVFHSFINIPEYISGL